MSKISRRSFVAATAAVAIPFDLIAAEAAKPPANPEVEARIQWIFTKYGSRLNEAQRADIRRLISGGQSSIDAMRAYALDNADDPATPFRIYRGAAK